MSKIKEIIAKRTAKEIESGEIVNLGIGIPTLVVDYLDDNVEVFIHSENGILGVGPSPSEENFNPYLVNAGKIPVTEMTGASYFDSALSFGIIRGGHVGISIIGALQVNEKGQIANWAIPGKAVLGIGGAMDLLVGAKKMIVTMTHTTPNGQPKIVKNCTYPLTGTRSVEKIITELAVFSVQNEKLILEETLGKATIDDIYKNTEANFELSPGLKLNQNI